MILRPTRVGQGRNGRFYFTMVAGRMAGCFHDGSGRFDLHPNKGRGGLKAVGGQVNLGSGLARWGDKGNRV